MGSGSQRGFLENLNYANKEVMYSVHCKIKKTLNYKHYTKHYTLLKPKKFRKDFGDLKEFADSLEEFGQFHEILKTKDGITIDGDRKEAAFNKYLKGKSKKILTLREYHIPFTFKELEETGLFTLMQIEANAQRKSFTIIEIDNIRKHIETLRKGGKLPPRFKGIKTREITGKVTNHGSRNISKIQAIVEATNSGKLDEKYIASINRGKTSIDTVYKIATREQRSLPKSRIPKGKYDCILIDFPIRYDSGPGIRGSADNNYPTIPLNQCIINAKKFPIADEAIIFLWITTPMRYDKQGANPQGNNPFLGSTEHLLLSALNVTPKSEFVWPKEKFGNGYYNRSQHETLLLCFKGKSIVPAKAFSTLIEGELREHSSKPNVWNMIKDMYPKRKYFECYRRDITPNVAGFGNQTRGKNFGK